MSEALSACFTFTDRQPNTPATVLSKHCCACHKLKPREGKFQKVEGGFYFEKRIRQVRLCKPLTQISRLLACVFYCFLSSDSRRSIAAADMRLLIPEADGMCKRSLHVLLSAYSRPFSPDTASKNCQKHAARHKHAGTGRKAQPVHCSRGAHYLHHDQREDRSPSLFGRQDMTHNDCCASCRERRPNTLRGGGSPHTSMKGPSQISMVSRLHRAMNSPSSGLRSPIGKKPHRNLEDERQQDGDAAMRRRGGIEPTVRAERDRPAQLQAHARTAIGSPASAVTWRHLRTLCMGNMSEPFDVAVGPHDGMLYVADSLYHRIGTTLYVLHVIGVCALGDCYNGRARVGTSSVMGTLCYCGETCLYQAIGNACMYVFVCMCELLARNAWAYKHKPTLACTSRCDDAST
jgi:hypothetical protein